MASILARSQPRDGYAVRVLAVHTSEGNDTPVIDDAAALRDASWWVGSSHAIADNDPGSLLTPAEGCVPYERASWTLRSGNRWSENIELIAQAGWTRAQWLARPKLLDRCAYWLAVRSKARGIPLVKLTPAEYRAGKWGVIGHHDHTVGYSDGTHWDPGPNFPWDVVIDKARAYAQEDDMPYTQHQIEDFVYGAVRNLFLDMNNGDNDYAKAPFQAVVAGAVATAVAPLQGQFAGLAEALKQVAAGTGAAVDLAAVTAAAKAGAQAALAEGVDVDVTVGGKPAAS